MRTAVIMVALVSLAACGEDAANGGSILIGSLVPRTGPNANADWVTALELAFDDMTTALERADNQRDIKLEWLSRDSASSVELAPSYARELVDLGAKVLTAESSDSAKGANRINYDADPLKVPIVCFVCTNSNINNPAYTDPDPVFQAALRDDEGWMFRTAPQVVNHSELIARSIASLPGAGDLNGDGIIKIVFITTTDTGGINIDSSVALLRQFTPDPTKLVYEYLLVDKNALHETGDFASIMRKAHDSDIELMRYDAGTNVIDTASTTPDPPEVRGPDILWNKSLPVPSLGLVRAYRDGGYTTKMIHHDPFRRNSVLATLGSLANGQEGMSVLSWEDDASGGVFAQEQRERTGWFPASFESNAYDALALVMLATVKAAAALSEPTDVTPAQIRDALTQLNDPDGEVIRTGPDELARAVDALTAGRAINYEGASGPVDFDARGDVLAKAAYWRVANEQYVNQAVYDCTQSPDCPRLP